MVIFVKNGFSIFFKTLSVSLLAGLLFFSMGYFYLNSSNESTVQNDSVSSVPYYKAIPETVGVLFDINGFNTFLQMNFECRELTVIFSDSVPDSEEIYGYRIDYTVKADSELLIGIADIFSGIDIEANGETFNYAGVQLARLLDENRGNKDIRREIAEKLISKIGEYGLTNDDFLFIINSSETNLTVPACYFWPKYICSVFSSVRYVN